MTKRHGIRVLMRSATELVIVIAGESFLGRFLFLPASIKKDDRVWLRIERPLDRPKERTVDVTARVTEVLERADGLVPHKPQPGMRFLITIESISGGHKSHDPTAGRFMGDDVDDVSASTMDDDERTWEETVRDVDGDEVFLSVL